MPLEKWWKYFIPLNPFLINGHVYISVNLNLSIKLLLINILILPLINIFIYISNNSALKLINKTNQEQITHEQSNKAVLKN